MGGIVIMPQSLPNEALGDAKGVNQARYHVEMTPESCSAVHPNMVPNAPYSLPQPGSGGRVLICRSMREHASCNRTASDTCDPAAATDACAVPFAEDCNIACQMYSSEQQTVPQPSGLDCNHIGVSRSEKRMAIVHKSAAVACWPGR